MANLQSQIDILAKAVVKEHIKLEDYKNENKGSVSLSRVSNKVDVYNNKGEASELWGGGTNYIEESHLLEVSKDGSTTTTIFTYNKDESNFSGFLFYDNSKNNYMVNDKGEIVSSNLIDFSLESDTFVRRIDLDEGEIGKTQSDKNKERMVYIVEEATVDSTLISYRKDTLKITMDNNEDENWGENYYVEFNKFENNNNKLIQLIIEIKGTNNGRIIKQFGSDTIIYSINEIEFNNPGVSFNIIDNNSNIVYAYRSKNIIDEEFANKDDNGNLTNMNNTTLLGVHLASGIETIGDNAFRLCNGLTGVIKIPYGVTSIGNFSFFICDGLTQVIIPDSVTSIGVAAFRGCKALTQITIPNSITSIGISAFGDCVGLTQVTIPNSVTSIGNYAFQDCRALTQITIPNSVTKISDYAFQNCIGLKQVTIKGTLTVVGLGAFNINIFSVQILKIQCNQTTYEIIFSKAQNDGYANKLEFEIIE